jgi:hypothetical protein
VQPSSSLAADIEYFVMGREYVAGVECFAMGREYEEKLPSRRGREGATNSGRLKNLHI